MHAPRYFAWCVHVQDFAAPGWSRTGAASPETRCELHDIARKIT
jgi:hypothetical protein